jgi:hypothetical protein
MCTSSLYDMFYPFCTHHTIRHRQTRRDRGLQQVFEYIQQWIRRILCFINFIRFKYFTRTCFTIEKKGKAFPLQAWCGSWGFRRLRLLDRLDFRHYEGGKVVTLTHRPHSPPVVFLVLILEAESTPGHMVPSVASEKVPSDSTGNRPRDLPTSSAVP